MNTYFIASGVVVALLIIVAVVVMIRNNGYVVSKVMWGIPADTTKYIDVTTKFLSAFDLATGIFTGVPFQILGDPDPSVVKTMNVTYTYNSTNKTFTWSEPGASASDSVSLQL